MAGFYVVLFYKILSLRGMRSMTWQSHLNLLNQYISSNLRRDCHTRFARSQ